MAKNIELIVMKKDNILIIWCRIFHSQIANCEGGKGALNLYVIIIHLTWLGSFFLQRPVGDVFIRQKLTPWIWIKRAASVGGRLWKTKGNYSGSNANFTMQFNWQLYLASILGYCKYGLNTTGLLVVCSGIIQAVPFVIHQILSLSVTWISFELCLFILHLWALAGKTGDIGTKADKENSTCAVSFNVHPVCFLQMNTNSAAISCYITVLPTGLKKSE